MYRLADLPAYANPLTRPPWPACRPIAVEDVWRAIAEGRTISPEDARASLRALSRHAERIAWLVEHPDAAPAHIVVRAGRVSVLDGSHRIAAALVRADVAVAAVVDDDAECNDVWRIAA